MRWNCYVRTLALCILAIMYAVAKLQLDPYDFFGLHRDREANRLFEANRVTFTSRISQTLTSI